MTSPWPIYGFSPEKLHAGAVAFIFFSIGNDILIYSQKIAFQGFIKARAGLRQS